jgi:NAD(P)-dependent dehydrogenase (short-subunit alcohol dehydrogenase family)
LVTGAGSGIGEATAKYFARLGAKVTVVDREQADLDRGMNQDALKTLLADVPIGRLVEPTEIAALIGHCAENNALNATTKEITGGLCNSRGVAK